MILNKVLRRRRRLRSVTFLVHDPISRTTHEITLEAGKTLTVDRPFNFSAMGVELRGSVEVVLELPEGFNGQA